jgi:hemerythrin-like domain-containing protein
MIVPVVAWHEEHVYFTLLLHLLQKEVDLFREGGVPNYVLMLDIVSYLGDYGDQFHHPREDEAFRRLAPHRPDLQLELARLSQEHRVLRNAGEALAAKLVAILSGAILPRDEVEGAAATYLVYYRNHLATEEEEVLASAAKELSPEDWEAIRRAVPAGADPRHAPEHYGELRRRIALEG